MWLNCILLFKKKLHCFEFHRNCVCCRCFQSCLTASYNITELNKTCFFFGGVKSTFALSSPKSK